MNFYYARYRTEKFSFGKWRDSSSCGTGMIVVIAENAEEAAKRIDIGLETPYENLRRVLASDVICCDGLLIRDDGGEGVSTIYPI